MTKWFSNTAPEGRRLVVVALATALAATALTLVGFSDRIGSSAWLLAAAALFGSSLTCGLVVVATKLQPPQAKVEDQFFALSEEVMCIACADGFVRRVNPAFEQVLGYAPAQMLRTPFIDLVHPQDHAATVMKIKRVTAGRPVRNFENRVRHRDGTYRWLAWRVTPVPGHDSFFASGRDVTELKAAQERAAHEQSQFKFIFDSLPVGVCLDHQNADGTRTQLLNDAHLRICGLNRDEATAEALSRVTHPDDLPQQELLRQQLEAGKIHRFSLEKRCVRPNGQIVWVAYTMQRRRDPDGSTHDVSTVVDISAVKRAQEVVAIERARFKFIFDSVPVGISLVLPGEAEASCVNPAHTRITGISVMDVSTRGAFRQATHPDDYERQRPLNESFRRGEIDHFEIEKRYVHPDGRVVWAALTRRRFTDDQTGLKQVITTLVDISARKEAETALADTHRQLMLASRQAGMAEVATGVLHNVGNVLNSVNVSANLLTDVARKSRIEPLAKLSELLVAQGDQLGEFMTRDPRGQKVPTYLKSVADHLAQQRDESLQELELLRKNIDHIKDIVSMQQSYAKVYGMTERVSVRDLVEDALRMNSSALARHGVALQTDFQADPTVVVEKHKVLQILVNLIRNAKYACDDSGRADKRVTIRTQCDHDQVSISVADNGVGIPAENLTRIFSHGFTTRRDGHGFGLHSGALAAKELGGSLTGRSEGEGRGAEFILELPLHRVEATAA